MTKKIGWQQLALAVAWGVVIVAAVAVGVAMLRQRAAEETFDEPAAAPSRGGQTVRVCAGQTAVADDNGIRVFPTPDPAEAAGETNVAEGAGDR